VRLARGTTFRGINVPRRLKDTVDTVAKADPALGRYLARAIKTGTFCSFSPV
jgi:hypothetical protein